MKLPVILQNKIIEFLKTLPNIDDIGKRQAFIYSLGLDTELQSQLSFQDPPAQFVPLLVKTMMQYGKLHDGRYALETLLEAAKNFIGEDRRIEECDPLIKELKELRIKKEKNGVNTDNIQEDRRNVLASIGEKWTIKFIVMILGLIIVILFISNFNIKQGIQKLFLSYVTPNPKPLPTSSLSRTPQVLPTASPIVASQFTSSPTQPLIDCEIPPSAKVIKLGQDCIINNLSLAKGLTIEFYTDGKIHFIENNENDKGKNIVINGILFSTDSSQVMFDEDGSVNGLLAQNTTFDSILYKSNGFVLLKNGYLLSGIIANDTIINGIKFMAGSYLAFHDETHKMVAQGVISEDTTIDGITFKGGTNIIFNKETNKVSTGTLAQPINFKHVTIPAGSQIYLDPKLASFAFTTVTETTINGITFKTNSWIGLNQSGNLQRVVVNEDHVIQGMEFHKQDVIYFSDDIKITAAIFGTNRNFGKTVCEKGRFVYFKENNLDYCTKVLEEW